jgi:hypothetical protein
MCAKLLICAQLTAMIESKQLAAWLAPISAVKAQKVPLDYSKLGCLNDVQTKQMMVGIDNCQSCQQLPNVPPSGGLHKFLPCKLLHDLLMKWLEQDIYKVDTPNTEQ